MRKQQLYQVAKKVYQVAEKLLFVPYIVQSLVDLIVVTLMEPKGYDPYENIYQEVDDGHHDKAVKFNVPFKDIAEQANDGI